MTQYRDEGQVDAVTQNVMQEVQHDMFNFLKSRLGNSHDAADVLQDFYVKVLTRFNDVRDNEKLRSWMYQVLKTTEALPPRSTFLRAMCESVCTGPDSPCESGLRQLAERVPSMGISIATAPKMEICTPWRKKFKTEL